MVVVVVVVVVVVGVVMVVMVVVVVVLSACGDASLETDFCVSGLLCVNMRMV